jgi:hypothetical protein
LFASPIWLPDTKTDWPTDRRPYYDFDFRLERLDMSAVVEHIIDHGHPIQFHSSSILATKTRYMDRIVREAIENELHPYNNNREGSLFVSVNYRSLLSAP